MRGCHNVLVVALGTALLSVACGQASQAAKTRRVSEQNDAGNRREPGNAGNEPGNPPRIEPDSGAACETTCSPDLRDVVDCNGAIVSECPNDLGCAAGECVAPCEAARLNASTLGCEFYSVIPAPESESRGACFAAMLANTWKTNVSIEVEYDGASLNVAELARTVEGSGVALSYKPLENGQLAPNQVALLFLSNEPNSQGKAVPCPQGVTPGYSGDPSLTGTGINKAFRIKTSAPVSAYDIYPYGGAKSFVASATLLIPTSAWGANYMAADAYPSQNGDVSGNSPFTQIVAAEDDTKVTIRPTGNIVGGPGVVAAQAGTSQTYTLSRGQVLQFAQPKKLAGSAISSDKPVGVWGGASCMNVPVLACCCDSAHQQFLPIKAFGSEHVAARYRDRKQGLKESTPWTLIGTVDGTALSYEPQAPAGAPLTLSSGEVVTFNAEDVFTIRSTDTEHPFHLIGYMTGGRTVCPDPPDLLNPPDQRHCGDPDFVSSVPPQQWLKNYVFLTDPTHSNTHLVFTRKKAADSTFKDVTLSCAGTLSGWTPVSLNSDYEVARVDLVTRGQPNGNCDNGLHTASSDAVFGLTVWGWDHFNSYAYPAGMAVRPINAVIVRPDPK